MNSSNILKKTLYFSLLTFCIASFQSRASAEEFDCEVDIDTPCVDVEWFTFDGGVDIQGRVTALGDTAISMTDLATPKEYEGEFPYFNRVMAVYKPRGGALPYENLPLQYIEGYIVEDIDDKGIPKFNWNRKDRIENLASGTSRSIAINRNGNISITTYNDLSPQNTKSLLIPFSQLDENDCNKFLCQTLGPELIPPVRNNRIATGMNNQGQLFLGYQSDRRNHGIPTPNPQINSIINDDAINWQDTVGLPPVPNLGVDKISVAVSDDNLVFYAYETIKSQDNPMYISIGKLNDAGNIEKWFNGGEAMGVKAIEIEHQGAPQRSPRWGREPSITTNGRIIVLGFRGTRSNRVYYQLGQIIRDEQGEFTDIKWTCNAHMRNKPANNPGRECGLVAGSDPNSDWGVSAAVTKEGLFTLNLIGTDFNHLKTPMAIAAEVLIRQDNANWQASSDHDTNGNKFVYEQTKFNPNEVYELSFLALDNFELTIQDNDTPEKIEKGKRYEFLVPTAQAAQNNGRATVKLTLASESISTNIPELISIATMNKRPQSGVIHPQDWIADVEDSNYSLAQFNDGNLAKAAPYKVLLNTKNLEDESLELEVNGLPLEVKEGKTLLDVEASLDGELNFKINLPLGDIETYISELKIYEPLAATTLMPDAMLPTSDASLYAADKYQFDINLKGAYFFKRKGENPIEVSHSGEPFYYFHGTTFDASSELGENSREQIRFTIKQDDSAGIADTIGDIEVYKKPFIHKVNTAMVAREREVNWENLDANTLYRLLVPAKLGDDTLTINGEKMDLKCHNCDQDPTYNFFTTYSDGQGRINLSLERHNARNVFDSLELYSPTPVAEIDFETSNLAKLNLAANKKYYLSFRVNSETDITLRQGEMLLRDTQGRTVFTCTSEQQNCQANFLIEVMPQDTGELPIELRTGNKDAISTIYVYENN